MLRNLATLSMITVTNHICCKFLENTDKNKEKLSIIPPAVTASSSYFLWWLNEWLRGWTEGNREVSAFKKAES